MADVVDQATRSRMMAAITGKNTSPERQIRKSLHRMGYRYRLHSNRLPGKPDIVLAKHRAVIFVNGCFWHGHDCHLFKMPATRTEFWQSKIDGNRTRDRMVRKELLARSWRVLTVWECSLKGKFRIGLEKTVELIDGWLKTGPERLEIKGTRSHALD